jgi:branched-chain amino acid aminotransferase
MEDRGFLLGDGLFETLRLYRGRPFRLSDHLCRLQEGAARVRLGWPDGVEARVAGALAASGMEGDGALRITLTRGVGHGLLPPDPPGTPTLHVVARPWHPDPAWEERGLSAHLAGRVDEHALTAGLKGIGYLERITALLTARERGAEEAILRNSAGAVVGGSASNLFLVAGGRLRTPALEEGILPGITRSVVLELARHMGLDAEEGSLRPEELARADEVFLTSSLRELVPVVAAEGTRVGPGSPGPVWRRLLDAFRERVRAELGA